MSYLLAVDARFELAVPPPEVGSVVHVASPRTALAYLLLRDPIAVVCNAGDSRDGLSAFRQLVATAAAHRIPVLVLTGERDVLFERDHFLNALPGPRWVEFRPCEPDGVAEALRNLLACSTSRPIAGREATQEAL